MSNSLRKVDTTSYQYIVEENVDIPVKEFGTPIRCNVYRPKASEQGQKFPVLMTYGPYGKDVHYQFFNEKSYREVNPEQHSDHAVFEVPNPSYWTGHGYIVVRCDERGAGQSPGYLNVLSKSTIDGFFSAIEWAAEQPWSTGKVGLLGISYYAATQWGVAARNPKGLAAIVPWEGFSDYYRDSSRHGGILSNTFPRFWYEKQIVTNQYGLPGRAARNWGHDTLEGDLSDEELKNNRYDLRDRVHETLYRDDPEAVSREFDLANIRVPVLSVGNWGGYLLHLRGNIEGYNRAGSKFKYLRTIAGRHDLPFYYSEEVELQRSFLDAFLKDEDRVGWSVPGKVPPVDLVIRKGNAGVNNPEGEKLFPRRQENEWPIARTKYTRYYLLPSGEMATAEPKIEKPQSLEYRTLTSPEDPELVTFSTSPLEEELEITGHITATVNVSVDADTDTGCPPPSDIDLFVTLRHIGVDGNEIFYTGTIGDPVAVCKGFLRVSHRRIQESHELHRQYLPYRTYHKADLQEVKPGEVYKATIEIWPTSVVLEKGEKLLFEVSGGDTQGAGIFLHNDPRDRNVTIHGRKNRIHFGPGIDNFVTLPVIPSK